MAVVNNAVLSHGTLESRDLQASRRFYEEVLGLHVRQLTPVSIHLELGDGYMYAAVHAPKSTRLMPLSFRNTLLFESDAEIDRAYEVVMQTRDDYGVLEVNLPQQDDDRYFFRLRDLDGNWWEMAHDDLGGYHHHLDPPA